MVYKVNSIEAVMAAKDGGLESQKDAEERFKRLQELDQANTDMVQINKKLGYSQIEAKELLNKYQQQFGRATFRAMLDDAENGRLNKQGKSAN